MPTRSEWKPKLGALLMSGDETNRCEFVVWAPEATTVEVHLLGDDDRFIPMARGERGYYRAVVDHIAPGQRYRYRLDGGVEYPDPATRSQPDGVAGASEVVSLHFDWIDGGWSGHELRDYIIYELHIGTFTPEGTYLAAISRLNHLVELGVTAVEFMPVNQFPGTRGWSYDGIFPFAPQHSYGRPEDFKRLVDACHAHGLAVILDVVYNHFGPEGGVASNFAPYTTDHYKTPWGEAINMDGAHSDEVREYFIENALYWFHEFHIDALRLDAVHYIYDFAPVTFIEELIERVAGYCKSMGRNAYLIAEDDRNFADLVLPVESGGSGMDAQWLDDFHHALHTNLIGETFAYYQDYGAFWQMVKAFREGFVYTGQYAPNRKRRHGTPSGHVGGDGCIVFIQNHDQIGNRMPNDRYVRIFSHEQVKLAVGTVMLAPYIPLIFMGDEYGETAPFEFFVDYAGEELINAVRKGRRDTFGYLMPEGTEPPDPQAEESFLVSKLNLELREQGVHRVLFEYHKLLIRLRKTIPALSVPDKNLLEVISFDRERVLYLRRWSEDASSMVFAVLNFNEAEQTLSFPVPKGQWRRLLASSDPRWSADSDLKKAAKRHTLKSEEGAVLTVPGHALVLYANETAG